MTYRLLRYFLITTLVIYISSCGSDDPMDPVPEPQVDCSTLTVALTTSTNAGCTSPGSAEVLASGGIAPYTFAVDGSAFQSSSAFADLMSGTYTITVKDTNDCTASVSVTISDEPSDLSISTLQTASAGCGTSEGEIEVVVDSGSGNIEFSINGGTFDSDPIFTDLAPEFYDIRARNEEGCQTIITAQVLSGITLSNHVQNIIETNCALPTCHGGTQFPDFRQKANILNNATNIASRTAAGTMPPTGALSQELIDTIACWVADGALDN